MALNVAWLAAASYLIARALRERPRPGRVEFVTNYVSVARSAPAVVLTNETPADVEFRWAQLESEDYRSYIERLRSIGCPEQTIRDIVIADVDKLLAPRMQAASVQPEELNYWEPVEQKLWNADHRESLREQRSIEFEKREVIRELLGADLVGERLKVQGKEDYHGARLGFLPEEKRSRVRLLLDQFSDYEQALLGGALEEGPESVSAEELSGLQQQKREAVAQLLSPQELEQFDLWFSPAAVRTREAVYGMEADEEEFLKIYQLQRGIDAAAVSQEELDSRLREELGERRYQDYARAQDPEFRHLYSVASRFNLPRQTAVELYGYQVAAEAERARVAADSALSTEQRAAAQFAITEETQRTFKEILGERAFKHYARRRGARAMKSQ